MYAYIFVIDTFFASSTPTHMTWQSYEYTHLPMIDVRYGIMQLDKQGAGEAFEGFVFTVLHNLVVLTLMCQHMAEKLERLFTLNVLMDNNNMPDNDVTTSVSTMTNTCSTNRTVKLKLNRDELSLIWPAVGTFPPASF